MDILFSFEGDRIRFFYLKRFELIQEISKAICYSWNTIKRINYNKIVLEKIFKSIFIINIINKGI